MRGPGIDQGTRGRRTVIGVALGAAMLAATTVGQSAPGISRTGEGPATPEVAPAHHYYYFDELRPLSVDPGRVAVLDEQPGGQGEAPPPPAGRVTSLPIAGWSVIDLSEPARSAADTEGLVESLAAERRAFVSPIFAGNDGGPLIVTRDILVGFHQGVPAAQAEAILAASGAGAILDRDWAGMRGAYRLRSPASDGFAVLSAANDLARRTEVLFAEPDMIFTGGGGLIPNDPGFPSCWGLHNTGQLGGIPDADMDAPEAWDVTIGAASIIVVVIDTGVQQDHPDIHQVPGADTTSEGPGSGGPVNACDNHGTPVAGCVSATINNGLGTVGVAPGCVSASARAFISNPSCDGSWAGASSWTVEALAWAETVGARVTNNSNYYGFTSSAIATKYEQTRAAGIVHFSIAGNFASPQLTYPGSLPSVNAVAALDPSGQLTSFSSYGPGLDYSAPGQDVYTTDRTGSAGWTGGDYVWAAGTSFASPYASGVAALVLSINDGLSALEVEGVMQCSSVDLGAPGYDTMFGWGFVNAAAALAIGPCVMNDTCEGASLVGFGTSTFDTGAATTDGFAEPSCGGLIQYDLWYRYVTTCPGPHIFSLCSSAFDTALAIHEGCPSGPGQTIACNDDFCGNRSRVSLIAGAVGTEYYLRVGSIAGQQGNGVLSISFACQEPCPTDVNGDGETSVPDLTEVIVHWGEGGGTADVNDDGIVNVQDLVDVINAWGPC